MNEEQLSALLARQVDALRALLPEAEQYHLVLALAASAVLGEMQPAAPPTLH